MSKRAEEAAMKALPDYSPDGKHKVDLTLDRLLYQHAYEQAEKDTTERACQLLYDYNKQMVEIFGAKAVLSCNQFTIDVERFRKTLINEEE